MDEQGAAPNGWQRSLLRRFRDGEREALGDVYRMHAEEVSRLLRRGFHFEVAERTRRFVGYRSAFDLQDALNETFRRAFEPSARAAYDGLRPYGPYLLTIARNVVLRTFRSREALFPTIDRDDATPGALEGPGVALDPEAETARDELRALVRAFLEDQTAVDRQLLTLRFVDGLSQRDVADKLGLGRQRVRTRESRLRESLMKFLSRRPERPPGGTSAALALLSALVLTVWISRGGV